MAGEVKRKVRGIQKTSGRHVMRFRQEKTLTDLISIKHLRLAIGIEDPCHHNKVWVEEDSHKPAHSPWHRNWL